MRRQRDASISAPVFQVFKSLARLFMLRCCQHYFCRNIVANGPSCMGPEAGLQPSHKSNQVRVVICKV